MGVHSAGDAGDAGAGGGDAGGGGAADASGGASFFSLMPCNIIGNVHFSLWDRIDFPGIVVFFLEC